MADTVLVGVLARPHGIRGELCVDWYAEAFDLLDGQLWVRAGSGPLRPARARGWRLHKGRPLLALEGVDSRDAAESLRGAELRVARRDLPAPDQDEFYVEDMIGCDVLLEDGRRLGRLDEALFPAGQPLWVIRTDAGKEILFPAQPRFIAAFDTAAPSVTIAPPEGLLEVYLDGEDGCAPET